MTLQEIKILYAFNAWATNRVLDAVAQLPGEQYMRDMKSSHKSIHGTLAHLVGSEERWLLRWAGTKDAALPPAKEIASLDALKSYWEKVGFETAKFLGTMTDKKLNETFTMTTTTGETFKHPYWQTLLHVVDHSTFHRGQVVAMIRQQGVKPPATGMMGFFRETSKLAQQR